MPVKAGWRDAPWRSRILAEAINAPNYYRAVEKKEIHYILTHPITKVISTGNLKTVLFLLP